jgi:hypothetical protein
MSLQLLRMEGDIMVFKGARSGIVTQIMNVIVSHVGENPRLARAQP